MESRKNTHKREFSKKILIVLSVWAGIVTAFSMLMIWITQDTGALEWLITTTAAAVDVALGFYFWKAKAENKIKLYKYYGPEAYEASGARDE